MIGVIYLVRNKVNGKIYIGQTNRPTYDKRWSEHLRHTKKNNNHFANALKKYGKHNFTIETLCKSDINELNDLEEFFVWQYQAFDYGYNSRPGGLQKGASKETRIKMSESRRKLLETTDLKERISKTNMGHIVTQETREKIRYKRQFQVITEEVKQIKRNKRLINNGSIMKWLDKSQPLPDGWSYGKIITKKEVYYNSKKYYCIELNKVFNSQIEVLRFLHIKFSKTLDKRISQGHPYRGYTWKLLEE